MKTLREILFERHRAAEPKLDVVRQRALASLGSGKSGAVRINARDRPTWISALLSLRWHLAGLSAAWLLVAILNSDRFSTSTAMANASDSTPRQLLLALKANRRQLSELIEPPAAEPIAVPRPRTEAQQPTQMA